MANGSHSARRVLITGAANWVGTALAAELLTDPDVELVVALDTRDPLMPADDRAVHVAADIRTTELARVVAPYAPDAVVHNEILQFAEPGRSARLLHDINVMGTLQLLAACEAMPTLRTMVVRSSAAIYGSEPNAPAFFTEEMARRFPLRTRWQRDVSELETLVDGHARRHPELACTILRPQPIVGAGLDTPIMRLLQSPVIPTWLGFDPRIQVVHAEDIVGALAAAVRRPVRGAGQRGRGGHGRVEPDAAAPGAALRCRSPRLGLGSAGPDVVRYLRYGRGVDTVRMREELCFTPSRSTIEAIEATAQVPA